MLQNFKVLLKFVWIKLVSKNFNKSIHIKYYLHVNCITYNYI